MIPATSSLAISQINQCLPSGSRHRPQRRYHNFPTLFDLQHAHCNLNITQDKYLHIISRLYASDIGQPKFVPVPTQETPTTRFPLLENHLMGLPIQPFIHDCLVFVRDGRRSHKFRIFCKNHCSLPINSTIESLGNARWHGDIIVMRVGQKGSVVNMRGSADAKLSDFLVKE